MLREAHAAYLYDIQEILDCFRYDRIKDPDDHLVIGAFVEKQLFDVCGFNVVRTFGGSFRSSLLHSPFSAYLKWKIPDTLFWNLFPLNEIPRHLRPQECYVYIRDSSVLIAYY